MRGIPRAQQKLAALDLKTGRRLIFADANMSPPAQSGIAMALVRNRASLLLTHGVVYVAFGSRCEDPGMPIFHGWLSAHDAVTLG